MIMNGDKEWYIKVDGSREGPFTVLELRYHKRFTPDTLVWKRGFIRFVKARKVPELKIVFKDPEPQDLPKALNAKDFIKTRNDELILDWHGQNPHLFIWFLVVLLLLSSLLYQLYGSN